MYGCRSCVRLNWGARYPLYGGGHVRNPCAIFDGHFRLPNTDAITSVREDGWDVARNILHQLPKELWDLRHQNAIVEIGMYR